MLQVWTMKLTASMNFCYISDRIACQRNFHGKQWFPANIYMLNGLQSENKRPITW